MGGFDDHFAFLGDWMPQNPSPRAFLSSMMGENVGSRSIGEHTNEIQANPPFPEPENISSENAGQTNIAQVEAAGDHNLVRDASADPRTNSRGGLVERLAARTGFHAPRLNTESIRAYDILPNQDVRSPYLTIPPGLSPTTLLDSPVFLPNSTVQPSPTTGKFAFAPNGNTRNMTSMIDNSDKKDGSFEDINSSSFSFKPVAESRSSLIDPSRESPFSLPGQTFPRNEVSVHQENSFLPQTLGPSNIHHQNVNPFNQQANFVRSAAEDDTRNKWNSVSTETSQAAGGAPEQSSPLDELQDEDIDQRVSNDVNNSSALAEDGYNWRKYGQKQVKGSEYPRSYYKCTHPNCQVKKKVERSHEGHITEIIYKGAHNHQKPSPNRRSALGSSNALGDIQADHSEQAGAAEEADAVWTTMQRGTSDWKQDSVEVTSSVALGPDYNHGPSGGLHAQNGTQLESGEAVDRSSTFSNDEDEDDGGTHGSVSLGYDGEGDESESKRRKIETYASEMSGATRAIREPRVVVQTTSEVDILDDGYRWRKYGQKVVKGNPNPRSYYKCTSAGCNVRKHVERASHDLKSVITTYEGKHNHDVPAARNSSSGLSTNHTSQPNPGVQGQLHRPEPSQLHHTSIGQFNRPPSMSTFGLPGRPHLGPGPGFGLGMNQQGLANLTMAGLGPGQGKLPVLPVNPYMGQLRPTNDMGYMLPKGEPKVEPLSEHGLNISNGSTVYQQLMSRLQFGPHM